MTEDEGLERALSAIERLASNVALVAGAIATLAEAVNGKYGGEPIYRNDEPPNG